VAFCGWAPR